MRTHLRTAALTSGLALTLPLLAMPATLAGPAAAEDPPLTTVASGLDNPRHLSFSHKALYVVEAGVGGSGPCFPGPEGGEVCYGESGAVTRVLPGRSKRVLSGLPSLAEAGGASAIGPADFRVTKHRRYALSMGLGADPALRDQLPALGKRLMGTLAGGVLNGQVPRVIADLAGYEAGTDPDGAGPDSNPTGIMGRPGRWMAVTDSGGNDLVAVRPNRRARAVAVFGSPGTVPNPFPPPPPAPQDVPMQAVPTSVVRGPDGALYISELTGFPFAPGYSRIHRYVRGMPPTVYATGLTNVTDLAWHRGSLYAVQLSSVGLLNEPALPMGSLVKVTPGAPLETVAGSLPAPYGVAFHDGAAHVTTCSVCADAGSVIRVPLG